jgi:tripartite ATP-independent transporter DctM subunit
MYPNEILVYCMFVLLFIAIMSGFPVAFGLGGVALIIGVIGEYMGEFYFSDFSFIPQRLYGIMQKFTLMAVPMFIFMGLTLEKSGLAAELLESLQQIFKRLKGGLAISIVLVGALLAASTGIVGATVVTMGAMALPTMLKWGYNKELACGTIAASGTLGQIIPPSIVLVLLGDMMNIDVGDLFIGAILPGFLLVFIYIIYIFLRVHFNPALAPSHSDLINDEAETDLKKVTMALLPPIFLMVIVLGSILFGFASPTEASACGALGALLITAFKKRLKLNVLKDIMQETTKMTCMVFTILVGAQFFGVVFRGLGGDEMISSLILDNEIDRYLVLISVMLLMFLMGFFLDFIEICFIVIPIVCPLLINDLEFNGLWLAILIAINLQTSFLTPPFGFALFYLKGVAPPEITTLHIYKGVAPFVLMQIATIAILMLFPDIVTYLPKIVFSN